MSKGNPFLALRFTRDQQDALRAKAAESGVSLSDLVRQVLADYIAGEGSRRPLPAAKSRRHAASHVRGSRPPSRPLRLQRAASDLEDMLADYETWQSNLPDSLQNSATADALTEAIENLQQAVDLLNAITPPQGFGRD